MVYKPCSVDAIREWKFLANLHKDAAVQSLKLFLPPPVKIPKKKKNDSLKRKVQNLMEIYRDKTDIHFFRACSDILTECKFNFDCN